MQYTETLTAFATDIIKGLTSAIKYIPSKYFYDDEGSRIFEKIMRMPEYYPTKCELEVFNLHKKAIANVFYEDRQSFDLIELGAGDGIKTKILLDNFVRNKIDLTYIPIDISVDAIIKLAKSIRKKFPNLKVEEKVGDYFQMMEEINQYDHKPKVLMFLGSNIGNFSIPQSIEFLTHLSSVMTFEDKLFVGFDLKKDPEIIKSAYNDGQGYTREFNFNLLRRMNRELGANFDVSKFLHSPVYNPALGEAKSYLVSTIDQDVFIEALNMSIHFNKWETIFTELSQKYDQQLINTIAKAAGFRIVKNFYDSKYYFRNVVFCKETDM